MSKMHVLRFWDLLSTEESTICSKIEDYWQGYTFVLIVLNVYFITFCFKNVSIWTLHWFWLTVDGDGEVWLWLATKLDVI